MKKLLLHLVFMAIWFLPPIIKADEGMWMPHQITALQLEQTGLEIPPDRIYGGNSDVLMNAVVNFSGGTGSFVSDNGLILTNHHVGFGAIQRASNAEHDYLKNGFLATKYSEELPAEGLYIDILLSYEEITEKVLDGIEANLSDEEKYHAVEHNIKRLIAEAEEGRQGLRVKIAKTFGGRHYYLYRFNRLQDIRIVYAPPMDLGTFGGDIDNWSWPRHTADFAFFRAYVSPEGMGRKYQEDNIPYIPETYLKISLDGFQEGDFSFVMGYPGKTYRNDMLAEFMYSVDLMQERIDKYQYLINFYEEASNGDRTRELKYVSKIKSLHNSMKNYRGKLEGFEKQEIYQKKSAREEAIKQWLIDNKSQKEAEETMKIFPAMSEIISRKKVLDKKMDILNDWVSYYYGPNMLYIAHRIYRTVSEREKPDIDRDPVYQKRNIPFIINRLKMVEHNFDPDIDRRFFVALLKKLSKLPKAQLPVSLKKQIEHVENNRFEEYVKSLYNRSALTDPGTRIEWMELNLSGLEKKNDPFISIAREIEAELEKLRDEKEILLYRQDELTQAYSGVLLQMTDNRIAPDANSTIRFTYGPIKGYYPADGIYYLPQTTLKGTIAKHIGEYPFNVPQKLIELHEQENFGPFMDKELQDVPACFLNTTNVTGGNSGSPTLNARGELIGLIFDMTYESTTGDYYIIPELQRTISVDVRYILFITEKFAGAKFILEEMGL